ncbi:hypothetical protein JYU19_01995 [bacterium AH-315-J21]|nr:hypothetical protein [bacterium AH-315-J21]
MISANTQQSVSVSSNDSGATIIEVLIAITLLFIALTAALYAQSRLAESLGTKDLLRVNTLSDSLMVELASDTALFKSLILEAELYDTAYTVTLDSGRYIAKIHIQIRNNNRSIRITTHRRNHDQPLHTLYYENAR